MISADHPRFSCTSDMSLTVYGKIFSGPLVHTNDPSGTGVISVVITSKLFSAQGSPSSDSLLNLLSPRF